MSFVARSSGKLREGATALRDREARRAGTPKRRAFRPDVQALRAVAVSAVVIYHFWPELLPGGFVGVDVFFVISGFLITGHLLNEIVQSGRIALTQFWARRIRRLLPAAFTVLFASMLALFLLMPSVTWQETLQEVAASATYVENWLLGYHAVDYLASENSATLAQHYWSLSVEEQFYIVWPLILIGALLLSRWKRTISSRVSVASALGLVFLISLGTSLLMTAAEPSFAFFATPTRAWEFAAGGLLATISNSSSAARYERIRRVSIWVGPLLILGSTFLISGEQPFPGWIALIPVAGAVICLFGGEHPFTWPPSRIVDNPVIQWLGNYSYSIYLWHWPLIIVTPWVLHGPMTWPVKLVLVALTLTLAYLTKRYVEDPVRTGRFWRSRRWPAYAFAATGMAAVVAVAVTGIVQVDRRNAVEDAAALEKIVSGVSCFGATAMEPAGSCDAPYARPADLDTAFAAADVYAPAADCQPGVEVTQPVVCTFGETKSPTRTIAVVGNSHAVRLMPALDLFGSQHGWKIILMAKTDCMGLTTSPVGDQSPDDACVEWSRNVQNDLLRVEKLDAVIFASHVAASLYLAGSHPNAADLKNARNQVVASWTAFVDRGIDVIVAEDVPGMRPDAGPECIAQSSARYDPCPTFRDEVVKPNLMTSIAREHSDLVSYLPLSQYFCDDKLCHALIGGVIVYSDSHHLTTTYSRSLAEYIGDSVEGTFSR